MSWLSQNWIWVVLGVGVLFVLGRYRARGGLSARGYGRSDQSRPSDGFGHGFAGSEHPDQSGPAIDPVTREDVATASALTSMYQGRLYYLATAENRQRFETAPAQYAREGLGHSVGAPQGAGQRRPGRRGSC